MNTKKILFYINAINGGGAERVIIQIAHHFANIGVKVILLTSFVDTSFEYSVPKNVERRSIEQQEIKQSRWKRNLQRIKAIRTICKLERPMALISFMAEPNFRSLCATIGLPVKTIVSVRNDPKKEYKGFLGYLIGKFLFRFADGIVFQTKQAQAWFPKSIQKKSKVIFNPVSESFYQVKRVANPQHIITCGRLSPQKNHSLLIRAFSKIADKYPQENLLIYGKGKLENSLKKLIEELHLQNRIFLMGLSSNVEEILSKAKLFVLSSDYEGMPNALMEALAAGVPSISTDCPCGGPKELIQHEKNGLLVPCKDEESLAQSIDKILTNPKQIAQMGNFARKTAYAYSSEIIMKQWESFVNSFWRKK